MEVGEPQFEADVQIGKTWHYIDRRGKATIEGGRITLRKRKGDVIADAPLNEVWTDMVRGSPNLWIGGERYILTPLPGHRAFEDSVVGAATNLARDVKRFKASKAMAEEFKRMVEAGGGHVGKPDK